MAVRIQFRRGTESEWNSANPILAQGELGYESTNKLIKFGDGATQWTALQVAAAGDIYKVKAGTGLRYGNTTTDYGTPTAGDSGVVELEIDPDVVLGSSVMNAKGDLIVGTGDNTYAILGTGTQGQTLVVNTSAPTGLQWGTPTDPVISSNYITNAMLQANSVTVDKIRGASVDAERSITTDKIRNSAITAEKMATNSVANAAVQNDAITVDKIRGASVDAERSITTDKIRNLAVTNDKINNGAVTPAKVNSEVYVRGGTGFTASSSRIFIQTSTPTGTAGDIWFKY